MSLKDHTDFHVEMIGKQERKFLNGPISIVSCVFKGRYFHTSTYLGSNLGHNPSYVWWSIFSAKVVIWSGIRWRIGSGTNMPVIGEPWLAKGTNISPASPTSAQFHYFTVRNLINHEKKTWNEPLVKYLYDIEVVQLILQTPLFHQVIEDTLVWKLEKNGQYSVRSAYRLCVENFVDKFHIRRLVLE